MSHVAKNIGVADLIKTEVCKFLIKKKLFLILKI